MCNIFRELNCNQTITVSWDEHLEISFQYRTYAAKETPFRSEIMRNNDLEQTNTLFLRENRNRTLVILRTLFAYMSPESIKTHGCSRISILFSVILSSLL